MANKTVRVQTSRSSSGHIDVLYIDNGDGTYSQSVKSIDPIPTETQAQVSSADMTTAAALTAAPAAGKKAVITGMVLSSDTAMSFKLQMETSANVLAEFYIAQNGTIAIPFTKHLYGDTAAKKIMGKASVAGNVAITLTYFTE